MVKIIVLSDYDPAPRVRECRRNSGTGADREHLRSPSRRPTDRDHVLRNRCDTYKSLVRHESQKTFASSGLIRDRIPRSRSSDRFSSLQQYEGSSETFPEKQSKFSTYQMGRRLHDLSPPKNFHRQLPSNMNFACCHLPSTTDMKMKAQPSQQKHSVSSSRSASIVSSPVHKSQSKVNNRLLSLAGQSQQDRYLYDKSGEKTIKDIKQSDGKTFIRPNNDKLPANVDVRAPGRNNNNSVSNVRMKQTYGLNKLCDALHFSFPSNVDDTKQLCSTEESKDKLQTFPRDIQCSDGVEWKSPPQRQSVVDSNKMQSRSCVSSPVKTPRMSSSMETRVLQSNSGSRSQTAGGYKLLSDNVGGKAWTTDLNKQPSNVASRAHTNVGGKIQTADRLLSGNLGSRVQTADRLLSGNVGSRVQTGNIGSRVQTSDRLLSGSRNVGSRVQTSVGNNLQPCSQKSALDKHNRSRLSLSRLGNDLSSHRVQRRSWKLHTSSTSLHCSPAATSSISDSDDNLSSSDLSSDHEIGSCSDNVSDVELQQNVPLATEVHNTLRDPVDCSAMNTKNSSGSDSESNRKRRASLSPSSDSPPQKVARKQDAERSLPGIMTCKVIPVFFASNKMSATQCSVAQNLTVGTTFDLMSHLDAARSRTRREFDPDKVVVVRGSKEGSVSFHSRPEFLGEDPVLSTGSLPGEAANNMSGILLSGLRESDPCIRLGQHIASHIDQHVTVHQSETNLLALSSNKTLKSREIVVRRSSVAASATGCEKQVVGCIVTDNQPQVAGRHIVRLTGRNKPSLSERLGFVGSSDSSHEAVVAPSNTFDLRAKLLSKRNRLKRFGVDESQSTEVTPSTSQLSRRPVSSVEAVKKRKFSM